MDVGFVIANSHAGRVREMVLAANEELTGSRMLRGMVAIGGVRRDWSDAQLDALRGTVAAVEREFRGLIALIRSSDSTRDRLERTGFLRPETAKALGIVGVGGRATAAIPSSTSPRFGPIQNRAKSETAETNPKRIAKRRTTARSRELETRIGLVPRRLSTGVRRQKTANAAAAKSSTRDSAPPEAMPTHAPVTSGTKRMPHAPCSRGQTSWRRRVRWASRTNNSGMTGWDVDVPVVYL
jgi:Ni,Fe-hydrogenase III large subunit